MARSEANSIEKRYKPAPKAAAIEKKMDAATTEDPMPSMHADMLKRHETEMSDMHKRHIKEVSDMSTKMMDTAKPVPAADGGK